MDTKHKVAPTSMDTLWELVKKQLEHPVAMFVQNGIKPRRGEKKKDAEMIVWMEVVKTAFASGVELGYDMGMTVAGAPDPEPGPTGKAG